MKEMKHAEKYGATDQYFADYSEKTSIKNKIKLKDPKLITLGGYDKETLKQYDKKINT